MLRAVWILSKKKLNVSDPEPSIEMTENITLI